MPKAIPAVPETPPSTVKRIFKISRKTFFHPSAWLDLEALQTQNKAMFDILKGMFTVSEPVQEETFAVAMARFGVKEEDLPEAESRYRLFAIFFALIALMVLVFAFYLLFFSGSFTGFLLGLASSGLFFSQAFKYDFWRFQIKHRTLGCTFEEWKQGKLLRKGAPHE